MLNDDDVLNEGFRPLKLGGTKQVSLSYDSKISGSSKPAMSRGLSFNAQTGAKESAQDLWEGSSWEKYNRSKGKTMDRANSFAGVSSRAEMKSDGAIVIVDPFSTGAHLASEVCKAGYKCVRVFSIWDSPVAALVEKGLDIDYTATVQHNDKLQDQDQAIQETIASLRDLPFPILAIIPGAETGVELADQLSHFMGLRSNGIEKSLARRNKYVMGETVRKTGIRVVKQATCTSITEVRTFLATLNRDGDKLKCVVKPVQSAGTDDVFLCNSLEEAETAFHKIYNTMNGIGLLNTSVLVQEYLLGTEYVVDKVSLNGVHKIVAIWQYDKRSVNGANFVYFGMKLMSSTTKMAQVMLAYADTVLTALDILNGPSHMEIMLHTTFDKVTGEPVYDPCLVEVGARCQGGEGTWLKIAKECIGYTVVDLTLDAYLSAKKWSAIEKDTYPMFKAGREVDMVSRHSGVVRSLPGDAAIRALPSFRGIHWEVKPGDFISKTIDCFTRPGCAELVADTEEEVERDFNALHELEEVGLIDYAIICPTRPNIGTVVVVDPFSSGANLAAMILQYGYRLILVFSETSNGAASLVANDVHKNVHSTTMIQHNNTMTDQDQAIATTMELIREQSTDSPIYAILAGAETGVELAERLASRFGTRSNGEALIDARKNKKAMQETVAAAGVRAITQSLCCSEQEVSAYFTSLSATAAANSNPQVIVKPVASLGSDHVYLCRTVDEAIDAFHAISNQINALGQINKGALLQEFLTGTKYLVDGVSRDGVYKVVAVWRYDKRPVNGANFVYFGMSLCDCGTPEIQAIIAYARKVVTALKIYQGPSHMEIFCTPNPTATADSAKSGKFDVCLLEVGARCNGGEGTWIPVAQEAIGYTQLEATLNCYLRPDQFDSLPTVPTLRMHGTELFLVAYQEGTLKEISGLDTIREMPSFRRMEMQVQPGVAMRRTTDVFTSPGSVLLVNASESALQADYAAIHDLAAKGELFQMM